MKADVRSRRSVLLWIAADCLLLFILSVGLIKPMFKSKYLDKWDSIESTFISDARFLRDHWRHPKWQPLWYCGTRFDYVYPPALRYGTALISRVGKCQTVKAYHIYGAFFFAVGIVGVYLMVRLGSRSRGMAWLCGLATLLMSPSFLLFSDIRRDAWQWQPQRLGVLVRYGEGPHMTALAMLGFVLAFAFLALPRRRPLMLVLSGLFATALVSNNFYGATSLAMFFPILVYAFWLTHQDNRIWLRALAIAAIAYGLTAFWLTPSYISITLRNMQFVSLPGNTWSLWIGVVWTILFVLWSNRWARGRKELVYPVFVLGGLWLMGLNVIGNQYFDFRVIGEPGRLIPELDLVMILAAALGLHFMWQRARWMRVAACVIVAGAFATTIGFISHAWEIYPLEPDYTKRLEYQITDWIHRNRPDVRAHTTGSVRFWYDAWHDLAELGGGSEQGLLNTKTQDAQWNINLSESLPVTLLWLQSMGVDIAIVHLKQSTELHHDITHPEKFESLPKIYDDEKGNVIYQIPRRWPVMARVVDAARWKALPGYRTEEDLKPYVDVIEHGPDAPPSMQWIGTDEFRVKVHRDPGTLLLVQQTYDPAWHAYSAGRELKVSKDEMLEFMVIEAPAGDDEIRVVFEQPFENKAGRVLSAGTVAIIFGWLILGWRRRA